MSFGQAVGSFFTQYGNFSGRTRRSGYWWVVLFLVIISIVWWFVDLQIFGGIWPQNLLDQGFGPVSIVWILATIVPILSLSVRRLHDTGKSGWWVLLGLIPVAGAIALIIFYATDSQAGDNDYGPNPKEPQSPQAL